MTHRSRLGGFIIDCGTGDLEAAAAFWRGALGDEKARRPQGRYVVLDRQGRITAAVQKVAHPSRVHLDIASDDIEAEAARLERLGAAPVKALKNWTVMQAPTGQRFCIVRARGRDFADTATLWEDGVGRRPAGRAEWDRWPAREDGPPPEGAKGHLSRLAGFIIDCRTDDLEAAAAFWAAALGAETVPAEAGYVGLGRIGGMNVEVQAVDHESRVHLDIASDDVPAEAARLERLGATRVADVRDWTVMEAPTGHRFCVIQGRSEAFRATARFRED